MRVPSKIRESGFPKSTKRKLNEVIEYLPSITLKSSSTVRVHQRASGTTLDVVEGRVTNRSSGLELRQCVIKEVHADYLVARLREDINAPTYFNVAKPWPLRQTSADVGATIRGMTVSSYDSPTQYAMNRTLKDTVVDAGTGEDKDIFISEAVYPAYAEEGQVSIEPPGQLTLIWVALTLTNTGVQVSGEDVVFEDINSAARVWVADYRPYKLCQDGSIVDAIFLAGEVG